MIRMQMTNALLQSAVDKKINMQKECHEPVIYRLPGRHVSYKSESNEPCQEKNCLQGFRPTLAQTSLLSYRD